MPTSPQGGGSAQQAQASAPAQSALAFADQLEDYVTGLRKELRALGDPNTVGRDTHSLRTWLGNIHRCELQIAQGMGIDWSPQNST